MKKLVPFGVDALLVIVFCAIGRHSHDESAISGLFRTVWPFGTGLLIGWVAAIAISASALPEATGAAAGKPGTDLVTTLRRFDGRRLWPTGVVVWLCTLTGGMVLRVLSHQGIALSFVGVAATVLALFLLGWRGAWKALGR
ncbi:DUF3054 domain-containing protein [Nocardia stercoris]|uniref:DUF3054 domain-containing protein n=1 Tax=Nocardia stercoris TaxID=2483361 RepID=A0A3M2L8N7_9NOCA|nr:DUF3054 domain-containing protein [Nocardia stercoris]RMI33971.1 DUF3054 domain-containing protein [Nocardia stercoris]